MNLAPYLPNLPSPLTGGETQSHLPIIELELANLRKDILKAFPEGFATRSFLTAQQMAERAMWLIERLHQLSMPTCRYLVNHPLQI